MPSNSTIQLQRSVNIVSLFTRQLPLSINVAGDPAFNMADWVRNFMLGPPFAWRWNRSTLQIATTPNVQDYKEPLPNFGWVEQATVTDGAGNVKPLEIMLNLHEENQPNLPTHISPRLDDGNGNITFRIIPTPDQIYTINLSYQNSAKSFQSLTDLWNPIPDYLSHIYTQGLLAKTYEYIMDDRYPISLQLFLKQLIATNAGLSDTQASIFLTDFVNSQQYSQFTLGQSQMGMQGRGM